LDLEESLNMRGRKIVEKKRVSPQKTGKQFFSSKMVVTIRFYTLESVGKNFKSCKKGNAAGQWNLRQNPVEIEFYM
jgi:hypothetical protein